MEWNLTGEELWDELRLRGYTLERVPGEPVVKVERGEKVQGIVIKDDYLQQIMGNAYSGLSDTVYVTGVYMDEGYRNKLGPDPFKVGQEPRYTHLPGAEAIHFRYEIDNNRSSSYSTPLQASLWLGDVKEMDLFSQDITVKPFENLTMEWDFDTTELEPSELGYNVNYTVKVKHEALERDIIIDTSYKVVTIIIPVEVDAQTQYEEVESIIKGQPWVTEVVLKSSNYNATTGNNTFIIEINFHSSTHNLTDDEGIMAEEQVFAALRQELGAVI